MQLQGLEAYTVFFFFFKQKHCIPYLGNEPLSDWIVESVS